MYEIGKKEGECRIGCKVNGKVYNGLLKDAPHEILEGLYKKNFPGIFKKPQNNATKTKAKNNKEQADKTSEN